MGGVRCPVQEVGRGVLPVNKLQGMLEQLLCVVGESSVNVNTKLLIVSANHILIAVHGNVGPVSPAHIILEMAVRSSKPFLA